MSTRPHFTPFKINPLKPSVPENVSSFRLSTSTRILYALVATGLVGLLGVSRMLEPDTKGFGTHRQLGLPPCTMYSLTGTPCPTCGMTTSWAYATRGEIRKAMQTNIAGTLLFGYACFSIPIILHLARVGRSSKSTWFAKSTGTMAVTATVIAIIQWLVRLSGFAMI